MIIYIGYHDHIVYQIIGRLQYYSLLLFLHITAIGNSLDANTLLSDPFHFVQRLGTLLPQRHPAKQHVVCRLSLPVRLSRGSTIDTEDSEHFQSSIGNARLPFPLLRCLDDPHINVPLTSGPAVERCQFTPLT